MGEQRRRIQGIIFDMDNTLLKSSIDFPAMKHAIFDFLVDRKVLPGTLSIEQHTTATLIEHAKQLDINVELEQQVWSIASRYELAGMRGAGLEVGVHDFLASIHTKYTLAVVTNNALSAAMHALQETGIADYLDLIIGREQMTSLKPSPSGFQYVLDHFAQIPSNDWISLGDSWIDGKGSMDAGIPFVSYQTDLSIMKSRGVDAIGRIDEIKELEQFL
ncbi:HAD family hydrolase [Paenibacillus radicis (ex Xue et al. 2023)]|uniref:HAD family hydrolase n=1 Tax=Paenibacillus radicis (ex Xue et al. 2023) TaxID=2972489 RepID=A0ABT1YKP6_9BACL|nr:HAD family hydrolase [Paenibacillus radicis (ex Xue et al. 2023)]MCR8633290.1 HAD family hydrolase [Paenibacillus radicis (ex Xue et al. 2023)]